MKWLFDLLKALFGGKRKHKALPQSVEDAVTPARGNGVPITVEFHDVPQPEHLEYHGLAAKEPEGKTPEEEGIAQELVLKEGEFGPQIKEFQDCLEALGYELSRFGADGSLGAESLSETREFQDDHALTAIEDCLVLRGIGHRTYALVKKLGISRPKPKPDRKIPHFDIPVVQLSDGVSLYDINDRHAGKKRKGKRKWKDIKGITLHQTAVQFGNNVMRFKNISAHIGVTPNGKVVLMNDLTWKVWHGNSFNSHDVGVEISGAFAGIEGEERTFWKPKSKPNRKPESVTVSQVKASLAMIEWVIDTVAEHGGKVEYIHAHRQSSLMRTSDPGSKVWKEIALEAKKRFGLVDGGADFKSGGKPIPKEWDPSYTRSYRG